MIRFSNSAGDNCKNFSNGNASVTSNFPEALRRNFVKCAPQPNF
jgi:hypothetical protein